MLQGRHLGSGIMSQWTVKDIANELQSMQLLLVARPNVKELKASLLAQVKHKLELMPQLQPSQIVELYDLLKNGGLPSDMYDQLVQVVDQKVVSGVNNGSTRETVVPQLCDNLHMYFTNSEWQKLESMNMWEGCSVIAHRLKLLGVRSLKEATKKSATALLVWVHIKKGQSHPCGDVVYSLAEHLTSAFQVCPTSMPNGAQHLLHFPASPGDLPPDHLRASYPDEQPISKDCPGLAQVRCHSTPVRSSSNQVMFKAG